MAYVLVDNGRDKTDVNRICLDDASLANFNVPSNIQKVSITTSEFNNLKNGTKVISGHDGTNYSFADSSHSFTEQALKDYHQDVIQRCNDFLNSNPSNSLWSNIKDYRDLLLDYDYSSITFNLDKSWEKYCEDNSITYFHPLQIP